MKDATEIVMVLDRSGSMATIKTDTEGGINSFVEDQKKIPGECKMTLVLFDSQDPQYVSFEALPIAEVRPVTFQPRASTPLYDAVGQAIVRTGERLAGLPETERPNKVLFVIVTDGYENYSQEYTREMVFDLIKRQTEVYKWEFVYLGANQDAMQVGGQLGARAGSTMTYAADPLSVRNTYATLSASVGAYRRGASGNVTFSDEDRKKAVDGQKFVPGGKKRRSAGK